MNFKDIESVQEYIKGRVNNFDEKINKSTVPENESYQANITIKITFTKGMYKAESVEKTEHKTIQRKQNQD